MEKLYSTFEVARICRVSPGSVNRWIKEGKLPASITAGGHHRVRHHELLSFLKSLRMDIPEDLLQSGIVKIVLVDPDPKARQMIKKTIMKFWPDAKIEETPDDASSGWKIQAQSSQDRKAA